MSRNQLLVTVSERTECVKDSELAAWSFLRVKGGRRATGKTFKIPFLAVKAGSLCYKTCNKLSGGYSAMKAINSLFLAVIVSLFAISSCSKSDDNKGPMEKAGQTVDKAMDQAKEKTGQAMEKAGEAIKEAGQKMRDSAEKSQ